MFKFSIFKIRTSFIIFLLLTTGCLLLAAKKVNAQEFSLTPSTASNTVGQEFTVDLNIDTKSIAVSSADVKLTYDTAIMDVVNVADGTFFSDTASYVGAGKVYIGGFFQDQSATKTGTGKLATLTLKGKGNGTSQLAFVCSTSKDDSNIFDSAGNDIIKCTAIKNGTYTFSGGSTLPTSTPTATTTATLTSKPTSTGTGSATMAPPTSGMFFPTVLFGAAGVLLTIFGIALIL